jgi:hypothetical protein
MWPRRSRSDREQAETTSALIEALEPLLREDWTYLEIGVASGNTYTDVKARRRVGVDPAPGEFVIPDGATLHRMPSREYFLGGEVDREGPFDVVFVDGLHLWEEALEDTLAAFEHLAAGGFVIVDDTYPSGRWEGERAADYFQAVDNARSQGVEISSWMGDVWRAAFLLARAAPGGLEWATIPVTKNRYHTVFWWRDLEIAGRSLRPSIEESHISEARAVSTDAVGDFTRAGIADWYHLEPFGSFVARMKGRLRTTRRPPAFKRSAK